MHWGTRNVLSVLSTCFLLWLGIKFLLPLCFPFLLGAGLAVAAEPLGVVCVLHQRRNQRAVAAHPLYVHDVILFCV